MKYLICSVALFIILISSLLLAACTPEAKTITVTLPAITVTQTQQATTITQPAITLPTVTDTVTLPVATVTQTEATTTTITQPATTTTETSTITSTITVMPPPTQESPKWTITYFYYYVADKTEGHWRYEWSLTIRSDFEYGLELLASINYLDDEGNNVYTGQASPLQLDAGETKTFLGYNLISAMIAPRITSVAVELEEI